VSVSYQNLHEKFRGYSTTSEIVVVKEQICTMRPISVMEDEAGLADLKKIAADKYKKK
jgi:hypothetical protein